LLDWLASKSKLKKGAEEYITSPLLNTGSTTPESSTEHIIYKIPDIEVTDIFVDKRTEAEVLQPEAQTLRVSMENVNQDKVVSSDIIYYDETMVNSKENNEFEITKANEMNNELEDSFIVYPSNYIAGFDEIEEKEDESAENEPITSNDIQIVEGITTPTTDLGTEQNLQDVMNHNTKIVSILQNTLEMQAFLFDKFFGYIG